MKKILILVLLFSSINIFSQSIKEDQIDEFTGKHIVRTSWVNLTMGMSCTVYFRMSKIDSVFWLDYRMIGGINSYLTFQEGEVFFFKLENGSIVKLFNSNIEISGKGKGANSLMGSGADGVKMNLWINQNQIDTLLNHKITKFRIQSTDGYIDKDISDQQYDKIKAIIELVYKK